MLWTLTQPPTFTLAVDFYPSTGLLHKLTEAKVKIRSSGQIPDSTRLEARASTDLRHLFPVSDIILKTIHTSEAVDFKTERQEP